MPPSTLSTSASIGPPPPSLAVDAGALAAFLTRSGVPGFPAGAPLTVSKFEHGQSNPTYLLQAASWRGVLRKKPPGPVLVSAHAVEREAALLRALAAAPTRGAARVLLPTVLASCDDASVLDTPFYVMHFVEGRVYVDPALPDVAPGERRAVYTSLATALAALHAVDAASVPPVARALGRSAAEYGARVVTTWDRQYRAQLPGHCSGGAAAAVLPEMAALSSFLLAAAPSLDDYADTTVVLHGDYRLDNVVFDATSSPPTPLAILDWELATAGPAMSDVAYMCLAHHLPAGVPALPSLPSPLPPGVPTEADLVAAYCAAAGAPTPPASVWRFHVAAALFRAAAILAGVGARAAAGNAAHAGAAAAGDVTVVRALAGAGLRVVAGSVAAPGVSLPAAGAPPTPGLAPSPRAAALAGRLTSFMRARVLPLEPAADAHAYSDRRWEPLPFMDALKEEAKHAALWNLWLPADLASSLTSRLGDRAPPPSLLGPGLSNLEYAHLAAIMGGCVWAAEVFNCSAPDTGNMEILGRYGTHDQVQQWLVPLLSGVTRSAFAMTEPAVASSDATNIAASVTPSSNGTTLTLTGSKWWISGALDPRCSLVLFLGVSDAQGPRHARHSIVGVPLPHPSVTMRRALTVFGYDDAPHGHAEVDFDGVVVPASSVVGKLGAGFAVAQARLGPGRLHHCARLVGAGDRALALAAARASSRVAFGKTLAAHGAVGASLARARVRLEGARLLVLHAAASLDAASGDAKAARTPLAVAKIAAPAAALAALDTAIQLHGGAGVGQDTPLARLWAGARTLRLADGPDEVHLGTVAQAEFRAVREGAVGGERSRL